jgi:hypothetical protein
MWRVVETVSVICSANIESPKPTAIPASEHIAATAATRLRSGAGKIVSRFSTSSVASSLGLGLGRAVEAPDGPGDDDEGAAESLSSASDMNTSLSGS